MIVGLGSLKSKHLAALIVGECSRLFVLDTHHGLSRFGGLGLLLSSTRLGNFGCPVVSATAWTLLGFLVLSARLGWGGLAGRGSGIISIVARGILLLDLTEADPRGRATIVSMFRGDEVPVDLMSIEVS